MVHTNVCLLDDKWASAFAAEVVRLGAKIILVIGGFPCKGLSKARGKGREKQKNTDSILFYEATRILEIIRQAADRKNIVKHIIENVIMDKSPKDTISQHLAGRPTQIPAGPVFAASRDRLFWLDFDIIPFEGELGTRYQT